VFRRFDGGGSAKVPGRARPSRSRFDSRASRFVAFRESISRRVDSGGMATSTVIRSAWYLPSRQELDLLFTSGRRYIYSGVPMAIAEGFAAAESKGRYYNAEIRNRFACRPAGQDRGTKRAA
jgi:hypothetical protein